MLKDTELLALENAAAVQGLDDEIALLRTLLRERLVKASAEDPVRLSLLLRGMELLVRAVAARHRISGENEEELFANVLGVIKGMGELMAMEEPA